ncbi:MAG: helix-turn-helix domain-containing protein [Candidatus Colwellbacteria bacterium]|nr:helix-turn-helix domain-containing protein [Candidatus Colwellbacteria bacterium]
MKAVQKRKAVALRLKGFSLKEISRRLQISKGTISLWARNVFLDEVAKNKLLKKIKVGQFISAENKKAKTKALEEKYKNEARREIAENPNYEKVICAIMYWCEGTKNPKSGLTFTNSDPALVNKFLELLRKSFIVDESKFRPCIHLHSYHSPKKQLDFWSKITKIERRQFIKPYLKMNSGKRINVGYQGCISVRYHSNDMARRVMATAKAFLEGV